jgi:hypothetical protein
MYGKSHNCFDLYQTHVIAEDSSGFYLYTCDDGIQLYEHLNRNLELDLQTKLVDDKKRNDARIMHMVFMFNKQLHELSYAFDQKQQVTNYYIQRINMKNLLPEGEAKLVLSHAELNKTDYIFSDKFNITLWDFTVSDDELCFIRLISDSFAQKQVTAL